MCEDTPLKSNGEIAASALSALCLMSSGERAKIRKGHHCSAFWRAWSAAGLDGVHGYRAECWENYIKALGNFVGTRSAGADAFISKERLGRNMAASGLKEARFERLVTAPLTIRHTLLDRSVLIMSRKLTAINIYDLCDLYLYEEPKRLRAICSSYYQSVA